MTLTFHNLLLTFFKEKERLVLALLQVGFYLTAMVQMRLYNNYEEHFYGLSNDVSFLSIYNNQNSF